jgi:hypothetical protein
MLPEWRFRAVEAANLVHERFTIRGHLAPEARNLRLQLLAFGI